jgi:hypothetical protein
MGLQIHNSAAATNFLGEIKIIYIVRALESNWDTAEAFFFAFVSSMVQNNLHY